MEGRKGRGSVASLDNVDLRLVDSVEEAVAFMRFLSERHENDLLAIDTESSGLHPYLVGEKLRLVQIGNKRAGWVIPWEQWGGVALEAIRKWDGDWALHNAPHDYQWLSHHAGVELPWDRIQETMVQVALIDPLKPKGLKPVSDRLFGKAALAGQKTLKDAMAEQGWTWATVPIDFVPYTIYAGLDPVLTSWIDHEFRPQVTANASEAYDLERGAQRVCTRMMQRGMLLDVPYVNEARDKLTAYSEKARAWLKSRHGITSPNSAGQLRRAIESYGQEILFFTDNGAPQFDKRALTFYKLEAQNKEIGQLADCVLKIRHSEKIIGSYFDNFLKFRDPSDIIHSSINTLAARTGRMSVTQPALQTLHRRDKIVRGSFIPRPGYVFVTCDLNQVESRMAAHFTGDVGLIEAFRRADTEGGDFFCELSGPIYGEEILKKDPRRDIVKTLTYRTLFGGGENVEEMALAAEVQFEQMLHAKESFDHRFPGLKQMLQIVADTAKRRNPPHLFSPFGRRFLLDRGHEFTQGLNALLQGHAAEYFKKCLLDIDAAGLGEYMVLVVHDEVILEVPEGIAEEAKRIVESCMSDLSSYKVPITAEASILTERWKKT
jgi:DNA polymerase-1